MTPASKRTWHRIADRLKDLGLSPQGEDSLPQWLLNVVLKSRDPKLTDLVAKLMSQGLDELEQDEREALFGAMVGDESRNPTRVGLLERLQALIDRYNTGSIGHRGTL